MQTALWGVLVILKISGIVLLGILALLLILLLLVLLVPLRYRIQGSYNKEPEGQAVVSWLCHLLSVKAVYKKKLTVAARVFGIRVFRMEKALGKAKEEAESRGQEEAKQSGGDPGRSEEPATDLRGPGTLEEQRADLESSEISEKQRADLESSGISEEQGTDFGGPATDTKTEETRPDQAREKRKRRPGRGKARKEKNKEKQGFSFTRLYDKLKKKLREIVEKLESSVKKLREGLSELFKKKEELRALLRDEANRRTWRLFKRQARAICRHILPTKITGRVKFGFDDPSTTGQVLTYISPFYGLYARSFQVIPVFEESVMEGQGMIKGRIRIGTLIVLIVRMFFDKNFRGWLRKLRKS